MKAKLESGKVIPAAGHKGGTATCKDKAVCEVCRQPYGELDKNNHTGGTEIKDAKDCARCTVNGYTGDTYCKDCGDKLESGKVIPARRSQGRHSHLQGQGRVRGVPAALRRAG